MLVVEGEFRVRGCARRLAWGGAHVGEGCVIAWRNLRMGEFMGGEGDGGKDLGGWEWVGVWVRGWSERAGEGLGEWDKGVVVILGGWDLV
jgi:hypothetical protein